MPRLDHLEQLLSETVAARRRDEVERMTPQQLKDAAAKNAAPDVARLPASLYFQQLAQELLDEADVSIKMPSFDPGKSTAEYETAYRQLRKAVLNGTREKYVSESKQVAAEELRRLLAEKGLDVTDSGVGTTASGQRFTRKDLAEMSVEEYVKHKDAIST